MADIPDMIIPKESVTALPPSLCNHSASSALAFSMALKLSLRSFFEILLFQGLFGDDRCLDDFLLLGGIGAGRLEHLLRQGIQSIDLQAVLPVRAFSAT